MSLEDDIWFTRKARIIASDRLLKWDFHSQLLMIEYSLILLFCSVMMIKYPQFLGENGDLLMVFNSALILIISLFIANRSFKERGLNLKNNYIEMKRLFYELKQANLNNAQTVDISNRFLILISEVENHKEIDDLESRIKAGKGLSTRIPNSVDKCKYYLYKCLGLLILVLLYIFPIFTLVYFGE